MKHNTLALILVILLASMITWAVIQTTGRAGLLSSLSTVCTVNCSTVLSSYQIGPSTSNNVFVGYSCTTFVGGSSPPSWCSGATGSFTNTNIQVGNCYYQNTPFSYCAPSPSQSISMVAGYAGGYYGDNWLLQQGQCGGITLFQGPVCGIASATLGGSGPSTAYQISYSLSAANWNLLGSSNDANWVNQFHEQIPQIVPSTTTSTCALTQIPNGGCNPYTITLTTGSNGGTIAYNLYRFTFTLFIQSINDRLTASTSCDTGANGNTGACYGFEVNALNQVLSFINSGNKVGGSIEVDLSIPDPFYASSYGGSTTDQFGIIGTWVGGTTGCFAPYPVNSAYGGTFQVTPCLSHVVIPNSFLAFTPASNEPSLTSYTNPVTSNLNPNAALKFTLNTLQIQYAAVVNQGASSTNNDCLASNGCTINANTGWTMQIPMVMDVIGSGPNLQAQAQNIGLITSTTTPPYNPITGNVLVHLVDSVIQLPIQGIPVGDNQGATCSTTVPYGTSDSGGNVVFEALQGGQQYVFCALGTSGSVILIFIGINMIYNCSGNQCQTQKTVVSGSTVTTTIAMQPTFNSFLTIAGILGIVFLVIAAVIVLIFVGVAGISLPGLFRRKQQV